MTSATDDQVIQVCKAEGRALVTLDLDFSNPLVFPPGQHSGIAVLRLPSKPSHGALVAVVRTLVEAMDRESLAGALWSINHRAASETEEDADQRTRKAAMSAMSPFAVR
jgi:predicted nuclease of predicted toxin-antitoxin system